MKKALCMVLWILPVSLFAQSPFDGTWKTNLSASKFSPKPVVFSLSNGMYDCDSCVPKIHIKGDGTDQNVAAPGRDYDTLSVKAADDNSVQFAGKKGGKPVFEQTRTVSSDGKNLTVSNTNYPQDGSASYKSESKWERVGKGPSGGNATSGSWRILNASEDEAGRTTTWKGSGDTLSMSTPTGVNWEAKFDGKEYPVKGTNANETVSLKQLNDRSVQATFKRDGKIFSVDKMTVSPDGKTITTMVDNKLTGRTATFVDEKQ
jgi:hypothetical protein